MFDWPKAARRSGYNVATHNVDVNRLDEGAAAGRALAAGLAEIEKERAGLLAKAASKRDHKDGRARQLLGKMPELVRAYRARVPRLMEFFWRSMKRWTLVAK